MQGIWFVFYCFQWILLLMLIFLNLGILRYLARLREKAENHQSETSKFKLGEHISNFTLPDIQKQQFVSQKILGQGTLTLIFFLSNGCSPCKIMIEQIGELAQRPGGLNTLAWKFVLVCIGDQITTQKMVETLPSSDLTILIDEFGSLVQDYHIPSTPFAIAINRQGNVHSQSSQPASHWLYSILEVPTPVNSSISYDRSSVPTLALATLD